MTVLHAGEIGRFDSSTNVQDADDFAILREGELLRITAEVLASYIVMENTTTRDVTTSYSVVTTDDYISADATGGSLTISLLALADAPVKPISIKKTAGGANTVTIDPNGSETIDGSATEVISSDGNAVTIVPHATEWRIY